jgi:hypothetical protein
MKIKWVFFSVWILSIVAFVVGQFLAPPNYASLPNNPWGNLFGTSFVLGIISFILMLVFFIMGERQYKTKKSRKSSEKTTVLSTPAKRLISIVVALGFIGALIMYAKAQMANSPFFATPVPTINNFIDDYKLFGMINDYRSSNKLATISLDDETCKIAQRRLDTYFWQTNLDLNNYKDVCPTCNSLSIAESQNNYNLNSILDSWKGNKTTLDTLNSNKKYGCVKVSKEKAVLVLISKTVTTTITNTDPITDCVSSAPNCNGESIRLKRSQCSNITCCGFNDGRWEVYPSSEKCKQAQQGAQPIQKIQKPTTSTNQLNFYCYDNTNKYSYYTSSGEQCNKNNLISSCKYLAQLNVWNPCTQKCKDTSSQSFDLCLWAYSGQNAAIKDDFGLFQECSNENTVEYQKCLDACGPSYQDAMNKCNF